MALMPRSIVQLLHFEEVARLLAGLDPDTPPKMLTDEAARLREWQRAIVYAVIDGSLCPTGGEAWIYNPASSTETPLAFYDPCIHQVYGRFLRKDVLAWLKSVGVSAADIPEAFRPSPKPLSSAEQPLHHKRKRTYLTLIEGLALEAMKDEIPAEPYKAAAILQVILGRHGLKLDKDPVADTVLEILAAREERKSERS
nr:hypothetical protein [uncultured Halomonas sp.]